ncbi:MAG: XisI protein [Bacteroidota bacterium]
MEKKTHISRQTTAIFQVIKDYADYFKLPQDSLSYQFIQDPMAHHYQLVRLGWYNGKRVHVVLFHLDLIHDKIWIQLDRTEEGIANWLVERGIEKSEIVLAYFSPAHRKHTEFAVA